MKGKTIAVTMGDPAGIGPEIVLKACGSERIRKRGIAVVIGDMKVLESVRDALGIDVDLRCIEHIDGSLDAGNAVIVLDTGVIEEISSLRIGEVSALGGRAAVTCVRKAAELALNRKVAGIATAPIHKEALRTAGYSYIGHTEMLSELAGSSKSITMFMVDNLKIFFHTRHISLRVMMEGLNIESVTDSILLADTCLRSLGFEKRRLALAALNPHASDGGLFGNEETEILLPACRVAQERGVEVDGPLPADSVFHRALEGEFDAVLSLYHDQGHIAAKTYDFYRTISVTLGLPFIRTSVDHGTAFDIAWKGRADPESMEEAILSCFELARKYTGFDDLH
jgi:4-hydroxythreonine-4-phosphate dehydrogenase